MYAAGPPVTGIVVILLSIILLRAVALLAWIDVSCYVKPTCLLAGSAAYTNKLSKQVMARVGYSAYVDRLLFGP